jgi:ubiquinone/menaquinone biosynthesis C-methylase UbiE
LQNEIRFDVGDALKLPYPDNHFDAVMAQAFFILIDDKETAIKEIYRVLKPSGYLGSLELSWFKKPSENVYQELLDKTCRDFIPRTRLFEDWEQFFQSNTFQHIKTIKNPMSSGMMQMMKTEGVVNFLKIIFRMMTHAKHRKRMMAVQDTFGKFKDYIGYGIYCYRKD